MKNLPGRTFFSTEFRFPFSMESCFPFLSEIFFMEATVPQLSKEIEEGIAFNLSANFIPTDLTRLPIESVERQRGYISLLQYGHHHLWYKLKLPLIFSRFIRLLFLTSLRAEATYGFVVTRDSSSLSIE